MSPEGITMQTERKTTRDIFVPTMAILLLVWFFISCDHAQALDTRKQAQTAQPQVMITNSEGRIHSWNVELAISDAQRMRGLMYRDHLAADSGMLFLFTYESIQAFWMKNTRIPLDMIFIRANMTIAGIAENAKPYDLASYRVSTPSMFVLEINGGQAKQYGLATGDKVRFENVPML
jgi:uncharacterized membrane protein (UPF0127 family)